jgi:hypothetical protein
MMESAMAKKLVDVFDKSGARLFSYSIALEDEGCIEAEFEEVALIFAERSGLVAEVDLEHLVARCDGSAADLALAELAQPAIHAATPVPAKPARKKSTVVSLIKHKMKKAAAAPVRQARHRA